MQLNATLAEFKKQAKDIDGLMEVMGKVAEVLIETFKVTGAASTPPKCALIHQKHSPGVPLPDVVAMANSVARALMPRHYGICCHHLDSCGIPKSFLKRTNHPHYP